MLSFISFTRVIENNTLPNEISIIQDKEGGNRCGVYVACRLSLYQAKNCKQVDILKICSHLVVERVNTIGKSNQIGFVYWFVIERMDQYDKVLQVDKTITPLINNVFYDEFLSLTALLPEGCAPQQNFGILNYFLLDSYSMKNRFIVINPPITNLQAACFWNIVYHVIKFCTLFLNFSLKLLISVKSFYRY